MISHAYCKNVNNRIVNAWILCHGNAFRKMLKMFFVKTPASFRHHNNGYEEDYELSTLK